MRKEDRKWKLRCPVCDTVLFSECNTLEAKVTCKKCRNRYKVVARNGMLALVDRNNNEAEQMMNRVSAYMESLDILNVDLEADK